MKNDLINTKTHRRDFLTIIRNTAAAVGLSTIIKPLQIHSEPLLKNMTISNPDDPDQWFNKITGKHKIVFDATRPHEVYPFAWPRVYLITNEKTGTPTKNNSVVVVLRHEAIPYAFENKLWEKYKFGEIFKADDPKTKVPSVRNPFWMPGADDFKIPGLGSVNIGINQLQADGVLFCVCNMAIQVFTAAVAQKLNMDAAEVKKDWLSGLLPGVQVVPSGVWAVGRAQEHGCTYCFAG